MYLMLFANFGFAAPAPNVSQLINQVIEEVKPCRVTLYATSKVSRSRSYGLIIGTIIKKVPTVAISLDKPFLNYTEGYFLYNNNISAPLHFIILRESKDGQHLNQLNKVFSSIADSFMYLTTTKIFLIFFPISDPLSVTKNLLTFAYEERYADFTILSIKNEKSMIINYYNYSSDKVVWHSARNFVNENLTFFPDRLTNLNGRSFRVGLNKARWPYYYYNNSGLPFHLNPHLFLFRSHEYFANYLNFTPKYILCNTNETTETIISNKNLEIYLGISRTLSLSNYDNSLIIDEQALMIVVPISRNVRTQVSMKVFHGLLAISSIMILTLIAARFFHLPKNEWSILNIYSLVLGLSAKVRPRNRKSRLLYLMLAANYLFFISDAISDLTDINFVSEKTLLIRSVDDAIEKNISVCLPFDKWWLQLYFKDASKEVKKFLDLPFEQCQSLDYPEKKIEMTYQSEAERILILSEYRTGVKQFEILDLNLPINLETLNFARHSPYRKKFAEAYNKIYEMGFKQKWAREYKVSVKVEKKGVDLQPDGNKLVLILVALMSIGVGISLIFFIIELISKSCTSARLHC